MQSYERASAVGLYEKALAVTILHLKTVPYLSSKAAELLKDKFRSSQINAGLIIPVPLSKRRRYERGFNQAEVLAQVIKNSSGIPVDASSLMRTIHTAAHRAGMDAKAREKTVQNAFVVKRKNLIEGRDILLVDDVFTTGSTVSACSKVLKQNGAGKVLVLTLARAH
jgi:ComF family protein